MKLKQFIKNLFSPKYRIVTDKYDGFETQIKFWFFPIWMQMGYYSMSDNDKIVRIHGDTNSHSSIVGARHNIEYAKLYKKQKHNKVVEYVD